MPLKIITSVVDVYEFLFPVDLVSISGGEYNAPCPFCDPTTGQYTQRDGIIYVGEDRLVHNTSYLSAFCRQCNKRYSVSDFLRLFGVEGEYEYKPEDREDVGLNDEIPILYEDEEDLAYYHQQVDRNFFYKWGWTDEVIDRYQLGKGSVNSIHSVNIMPLPLRRVGVYSREYTGYLTGRWYHNGATQHIHSKGTVRNMYGFFPAKEASSVVLLAEGEKDAITLSWMFPEYNVAVTLGTGHWKTHHTEDLKNRGFSEFWLCLDNDSSGQDLSKEIVKQNQLERFGLTIKTLNWSKISSKVSDVTDLLSEKGFDQTRTLVSSAIEEDSTSEIYVKTYEHAPVSDFVTIEDLRGDGEDSLQYVLQNFLDTYQDYGRSGAMLLFAVPPGVGKSYRAIHELEDRARTHLKDALDERKRLKSELQEMEAIVDTEDDQKAVESFRETVEEHNVNFAAWFGMYNERGVQGIKELTTEESLWYFFDSRNKDNCEMYDTYSTYARNGYNAGKYCRTLCPAREFCQANQGQYLHQEVEMRDYPLVFYRHQHLFGNYIQKFGFKMVVVDENPTGILEEPIKIQGDQIQITSELEILESEDLINALVKSIQTVMVKNRGTNGDSRNSQKVVGKRLMKLLDLEIQSLTDDEYTLATLLDMLTDHVVEMAQPLPNIVDPSLPIPKRVLPQLVTALRKELVDYVNDPDGDSPSYITMQYGIINVTDKDIAPIPKKVPIIALDATALPILYQSMFSRKVELFAPKVKNPNARIIQIRGSDFTATSRYHDVTRVSRMLREAEETKVIRDMEGNKFPLTDKGLDPYLLLEFPTLRDAYRLILWANEQHDSLLVITHKNTREILEKFLPECAKIVHYNETRGSNEYQLLDAALLIGAYRIPYSVVVDKVNFWSRRIGITQPVPTFEGTELAYKRYGDTNEEGVVRYFSHSLADAYLDMVEAGETIQASERIRPHSGYEEKTIYMASNRPSLPYVTEVLEKRDLVGNKFTDKRDATLEFMIDFFLEYGRIPKRREVNSFCYDTFGTGISNNIFTEHRNTVTDLIERNAIEEAISPSEDEYYEGLDYVDDYDDDELFAV